MYNFFHRYEQNLTCNKLGYLIPQIVNKYGNKEVDMGLIILPNSVSEFSEDKIYASINI